MALAVSGYAGFPPIADIRLLCDLRPMIDPCCEMMRSYGRDRYKGVPEAELPEALIQVDRDADAAMLLTPSGRYEMFIQHCPWCGARIGKQPHELRGYN